MNEILLITRPITRRQLKELAAEGFGDLVKAVADVKRRVLAIGGELHADAEAFLLEQGSLQRDLWGINFYPDLEMPDMLEFDSLINIRPSQGNRSRSVDDPAIRQEILEIVARLVE